MDKTEYERIQKRLFEMAAELERLDLAGFLEAIERVESVGPFLDPTLYMDGIDNVRIVKRLAEGARALQAAAPTPLEKGQMLTRIAQHHLRRT